MKFDSPCLVSQGGVIPDLRSYRSRAVSSNEQVKGVLIIKSTPFSLFRRLSLDDLSVKNVFERQIWLAPGVASDDVNTHRKGQDCQRDCYPNDCPDKSGDSSGVSHVNGVCRNTGVKW